MARQESSQFGRGSVEIHRRNVVGKVTRFREIIDTYTNVKVSAEQERRCYNFPIPLTLTLERRAEARSGQYQKEADHTFSLCWHCKILISNSVAKVGSEKVQLKLYTADAK